MPFSQRYTEMANENEWDRLSNPPPPLFTGTPEKNLVKQVNDELIERVIGQIISYYAVDLDRSNFHPLYGECIDKTFLPPIRVYCLVDWEGNTTTTTDGAIDKRASITVHFHKRRLTEDQDLYVREGDFVAYGDSFYEIVTLNEPTEIFGRTESKMEISAKCVKSRDGTFNAE